jgi:predicted DNA-binding transcriptional regulator AlpA
MQEKLLSINDVLNLLDISYSCLTNLRYHRDRGFPSAVKTGNSKKVLFKESQVLD